MDNFIHILAKPDNMPIAGMVIVLALLLGVWLRQALRHDKLIRDGNKADIAKEMRK